MVTDATPIEEGAIDIREFCRRNSVSKSSAYNEIAAGKLIAHKYRSKTLIYFEDERAWRASLPKFPAGKCSPPVRRRTTPAAA